jgi:RHS repeat-associated protein
MYGVNGKVTAELAAVYDPAAGVQPGMVLTPTATYQYVGTRKVGWNEPVEDRLGTKPAGSGRPYGENVSQYATHQKDATGLHYADQRYYSSQYGRFLTPDPTLSSNATVLPGNWNRYAYVGGDPINKHDPRGLCSPQDDPPCYSTTAEEMSEETRRAYEAWYDFLVRVGQSQTNTVSAPPPPVTAEDHARQALPRALTVALSALANNKECMELFGTEETRVAGFDPSSVLWSLASGGEINGRKLGRIDLGAATLERRGTLLDSVTSREGKV